MNKKLLLIGLGIGLCFTGCQNRDEDSIKKATSIPTTSVTNEIKDKNLFTMSPELVIPIQTSKDAKLQLNDYKPCVYGWTNEEGMLTSVYVLGGYRGNKWYKLEDFNFIHNNKEYTYKEIVSNLQTDFVKVHVPLIKGSERFKFYSEDNNVFYAEANGIPTLYESQASGQVFLEVNIKPIKIKSNTKSVQVSTLVIGVNGDWDALQSEKVKVVDNKFMCNIDLNGDGDLEYVEFKSSIEGYIYVSENAEQLKSSERIFSQDLGD